MILQMRSPSPADKFTTNPHHWNINNFYTLIILWHLHNCLIIKLLHKTFHTWKYLFICFILFIKDLIFIPFSTFWVTNIVADSALRSPPSSSSSSIMGALLEKKKKKTKKPAWKPSETAAVASKAAPTISGSSQTSAPALELETNPRKVWSITMTEKAWLKVDVCGYYGTMIC